MKIIRSIHALQKALDSQRRRNKQIGFVPTMGYFHDGHLSLMRKARKENDCVVVSIYVNPTQFGPKEDLKKYPRNRNRDVRLARAEKVDFLFCPSTKEMYPQGFGTYVTNEPIADILCGATRPGHFKGVATIVCKLFNIVGANVAYFGQKDYQQLCIIKQLIKDLNIRTRIKMCPIVREADGLAMSSRNTYLNADQRERAVVLSHALCVARTLIKSGERRPHVVINKMKRMLLFKVDRLDYIAVLNATDLSKVRSISGKMYIGIAAYIGKTRLIDNIVVQTK